MTIELSNTSNCIMKLDQYKTDDGYILNDTRYETPVELVLEGMLGFCGCGDPDGVIEYLTKSLLHISNLKQLVWEKKLSFEEWNNGGNELHPVTGSDYFMWYVLDSKEFTEHGGSVPGWLTSKGEELLELLNEI